MSPTVLRYPKRSRHPWAQLRAKELYPSSAFPFRTPDPRKKMMSEAQSMELPRKKKPKE
ncbi:hypothetical protein SAMN02745166_04329 [Prosthecobacter debontii]|uniref:Uncharacterized protein n=1 Tax=Prosthecobacter debontii TaxID=48467 RepID=A0A1T4YV84_9BACT|nr:hypothetical protein SAMN02745166_04329 [Prosthecobacter debontii]